MKWIAMEILILIKTVKVRKDTSIRTLKKKDEPSNCCSLKCNKISYDDDSKSEKEYYIKGR